MSFFNEGVMKAFQWKLSNSIMIYSAEYEAYQRWTFFEEQRESDRRCGKKKALETNSICEQKEEE